jgi:hypothetical protein
MAKSPEKTTQLILLHFSEFGGEEGIAAQASDTRENQLLVTFTMTPCVQILRPRGHPFPFLPLGLSMPQFTDPRRRISLSRGTDGYR